MASIHNRKLISSLVRELKEKYKLLMKSAPMRGDPYMKASLMDTTLNVHGIMQYLMLEMVKFRMQQYGQQTLILINIKRPVFYFIYHFLSSLTYHAKRCYYAKGI
jgi:hypothetical protein